MVKKILLLLAIILISFSCTLNKEARRKNRAAKKLERLVDRFPELLVPDTITDTIRVEIPEIIVDTVVLKSDTISVSKDRWRVQVITRLDSVFITGGCDSIFVDRIVKVPYSVIQPVKVEKPKLFRGIQSAVFWLLIAAVVLFIVSRFLKYK